MRCQDLPENQNLLIGESLLDRHAGSTTEQRRLANIETVARKAGDRTRKRGWKFVWASLREPATLVALLLAAAIAVGVVVAESAIVRAIGLRVTHDYEPFMLGVATTFAVLLVVGFTITYSGAISWIVGGEAERWTAKELSRGNPLATFHNLVFAEGEGKERIVFDIDHVVVGASGVLVVESKFSGHPLDLGSKTWSRQVRRDAAQVSRNVKRVRTVLAHLAPGIPIRPVLVYWGRKVLGPADDQQALGRVQVILGRDRSAWLALAADGATPLELQQAAASALQGYQKTSHEVSD